MKHFNRAALLTVSLSLLPLSLTAAGEAMKVGADSFRCIREMTPVRHFYVDNLLGNLEGTLAAANAPKGAIYPPGSVVQLVPSEVMVKREAGFSPATGDWEFFELDVSEKGSTVRARGFAEVNNRFGGNCFACHAPARQPWDFVCETGHGCESIPVTRKMIGALQRSDPRCGEEVLEEGDSWALFKLNTLVLLGKTKAAITGWF
ncbi:hypothetical protein [Pseudomonas sp. HAR-UPW-AIA-41]|uniref:hypothetical protein n=1 Tax=Pseudomonas sp. HAR-UPW-AIA-41 TaxID=1985301 RepID=UPI001C453D8F|nr:hypothetical protein [Pseudomonas sp. HAR-UPW-AIA-41]